MLRWALLTLLFLAVYAPFSGYLDLQVTRFFYDEGFHPSALSNFLFLWGVFPADIVAVAAAYLFLASYVKPTMKKFRQHGLVLFLSLVLGGGLITHLILKDHWGRPRPKQVVEFGGTQQYRAFYEPYFDNPEVSKSFPCGHCTCGFYFLALVFVGRKVESPLIEATGWVLGLGLGLLLSWARIEAGGHWLSDVLITAIIMWFSAWICARVIYRMHEEPA